jgi:hypothetical protein
MLVGMIIMGFKPIKKNLKQKTELLDTKNQVQSILLLSKAGRKTRSSLARSAQLVSARYHNGPSQAKILAR